MDHLQIKRVAHNEVKQLQAIGLETFTTAFSSYNTAEDMKAYLSKAFSTEQLTSELSNRQSEFYFALLDNEVIGYLKINFGQTKSKLSKENTMEIERVYVLAECQGKKVGQRLLNKALEIAKQKNMDGIWLGVWEENPNAVRFYRNNGYKKSGKHAFYLGSEKQIDIIMKLQLDNG